MRPALADGAVFCAKDRPDFLLLIGTRFKSTFDSYDTFEKVKRSRGRNASYPAPLAHFPSMGNYRRNQGGSAFTLDRFKIFSQLLLRLKMGVVS